MAFFSRLKAAWLAFKDPTILDEEPTAADLSAHFYALLEKNTTNWGGVEITPDITSMAATAGER